MPVTSCPALRECFPLSRLPLPAFSVISSRFRKFSFDAGGALSRMEDRHTNAVTVTRNAGGFATQIALWSARFLALIYDTTSGKLVRIDAKYGAVPNQTVNTWTLAYDTTTGRLAKIALTHGYDTNGRLTSHQAGSGGGLWSVTYSAAVGANGYTQVTDPRSNVTRWDYTWHTGRYGYTVTSTVDALGRTTTYERNAAPTHLVTAIVDFRGRRLSQGWDATKGNLTSVTLSTGVRYWLLRAFDTVGEFGGVDALTVPKGDSPRRGVSDIGYRPRVANERNAYMFGRTLSLCAALGALLLMLAPSHGSTLIRRTLPQLAAGSDLIFVGRCEAVTPHWNRDRTLILTAYRFRVLRAIKGSPGATITLDELGGVVNGVGMNVPGVPRYSVGEEVLLCVHRTELGRWETYGATQGKFPVERDAQGRPWVRSHYYTLELATMRPPDRTGAGAPLDVLAGHLRNLPPAALGTGRLETGR